MMPSTLIHYTSIFLLLPSVTSFSSNHHSTHGLLSPSHVRRRTLTPFTVRWNAHDSGDSWLMDDDEGENYSHNDDDNAMRMSHKPRNNNNNNNNNKGTTHSTKTKQPHSRRNTNHDNPRTPHDNENTDIRTYFATCIPGLHTTLAAELVSLGATDVQPMGSSGVSFRGVPSVGLQSVLWCRTAHKIMELIVSSCDSSLGHGYEYDEYNGYQYRGIRSGNELYQFVQTCVHTPSLLGNGRGGLHTLSVSTIYASRVPRELCHGHFTALTVKNALVDSVRELREDGVRPDVDVEDADVPLVVVLRGRRRLEEGRRRNGRNGATILGRGKNDGRGYAESPRKEQEEEEEGLVADVDIYRCLHSGGSLHKRGYRSENFGSEQDDIRNDDDSDLATWEMKTPRRKTHPNKSSNNNNTPIHRAAMKESLAAGLLLESGWDKLIHAARSDGCGAVFIDPMTGSGTFPIEAALIACDVAPGLLRMASWKNGGGVASSSSKNPHRFPPAVRWKDFCEKSTDWEDLLADAARRAKSGVDCAKTNNVSILCNEKNSRAIALARTSIKNSGVGSIISLHEGDCLDWTLDSEAVIEGRTIFACNPPWGIRLTEDIDESWVSLREFLRREGNGAEAWVLSGNKDLTKILRMKKSRSVVVRTAEEDLRWLQYHIFRKSEAPVV
ncbi:hypothetical protein HJC23_004968 [Cyclotella cryptica]|uniref:Uncharacterized protein n=1 Tax=Cyclotella cryptica TaxID=29204 RepID=A0ABD3P9D0_9STRA|eukprot:CCRYP_016613-RA/>CCRYP_016613-RA protein AED:0.02 eAED:0.02 QI:498/-1/1/1/-1/1/1/248/667